MSTIIFYENIDVGTDHRIDKRTLVNVTRPNSSQTKNAYGNTSRDDRLNEF